MPEAHPYRRVLALISFDSTDETIARKALLLARLNRSQLVFLHLIEPDAALDGGYPAASAKDNATALEAGALHRLDFMATQLGAGEAECIARHVSTRQSINPALQSLQPDLVVAATEYGLRPGSYDMLILGEGRRPKGGRLVSRLMGWLGSSFQPAAL